MCTTAHNMKPRHIRINEDTHQQLAKLSNEYGVSMTALVQIAVTQFTAKGSVKAKRDVRYTKANIRSLQISPVRPGRAKISQG